MFTELEWWGYLTIAALPLVGFALGFRWARRNPAPSPRDTQPLQPSADPRFLDVVDGVQRQLEELAERQEFTERLLARRTDLPAPPPPATGKVPTPV